MTSAYDGGSRICTETNRRQIVLHCRGGSSSAIDAAPAAPSEWLCRDNGGGNRWTAATKKKESSWSKKLQHVSTLPHSCDLSVPTWADRWFYSQNLKPEDIWVINITPLVLTTFSPSDWQIAVRFPPKHLSMARAVVRRLWGAYQKSICLSLKDIKAKGKEYCRLRVCLSQSHFILLFPLRETIDQSVIMVPSPHRP